MSPRLPGHRDQVFPVGPACDCGSGDTFVRNVRRRRNGTIWRRHVCRACGLKFSTIERRLPSKAA
jgi:transcriptional regulator NrdR family protein